MGLQITAGCDTALDRTWVCSDASSNELQCLRPLCHSGVLIWIRVQQKLNALITPTVLMYKILNNIIWLCAQQKFNIPFLLQFMSSRQSLKLDSYFRLHFWCILRVIAQNSIQHHLGMYATQFNIHLLLPFLSSSLSI